MKLINKDAVLAIIEKELSYYKDLEDRKTISDCGIAGYRVVKMLKSDIESLEVKEVDLDEPARHYLLHEHVSPLNEVLHQADLKVEMQYHKDIENAYKAGFELGLKAKDK